MRLFVSFAFLSLTLIGSPATSQYLVVGESAASACYQHAAFQRADMDALGDCNSAIDHETLRRSDRAATHVNRGIIQMRRGQIDAALADFDRAERLLTRIGPALAVNRSSAFIRLGRYEDALIQTDIAIAAESDNLADAWFNRGVALEAMGDTSSAYFAYAEALALRPGWRPAERELERFTVQPGS